jgi:hypothetical protein
MSLDRTMSHVNYNGGIMTDGNDQRVTIVAAEDDHDSIGLDSDEEAQVDVT